MNIKHLISTLSIALMIGTSFVYADEAKKAAEKAPEAKAETATTEIDKDVAAAITEADNARKAAKKVGFEWRDTSKMLKKAHKAAESGDKETALKIAAKAKFQGEMGLKQAEIAKNVQPVFLK